MEALVYFWVKMVGGVGLVEPAPYLVKAACQTHRVRPTALTKPASGLFPKTPSRTHENPHSRRQLLGEGVDS